MERAKNIFGTAAGTTYGWIFDAVSIGIQTAGTLFGIFRPGGRPGDRPIGITRDPNNPDDGVFVPKVIELTKARAEALLAANLTGQGTGIFTVEYKDDDYLRGDYILWFQIQRVGPNNPDAPHTAVSVGRTLPPELERSVVVRRPLDPRPLPRH